MQPTKECKYCKRFGVESRRELRRYKKGVVFVCLKCHHKEFVKSRKYKIPLEIYIKPKTSRLSGETKIRTSSMTEKQFILKAESSGWNVLKRGWPDFILHKDTGEFCFVEVKRDTQDHLKREQRFVCNLLSKMGAKVYMWKPTLGFIKIDYGL